MRTLFCIEVVIIITLILTRCANHNVITDSIPEDPMSVKVDALNSALSHAQLHIEELDAKLSALSDKEEATRLMVVTAKTNKFLKIKTRAMAQKFKKVAFTETSIDEAVQLFTASMNLFKSAKYSEAELAFNHFTEMYPEHVLAGSAQFYAGESYFKMGEYQLALNEYQKVLSSFRASPRVATALVRISHCYTAIGDSVQATAAMTKAHEIFEGNPSLEWIFSAVKKKTDLTVAPIEPHED